MDSVRGAVGVLTRLPLRRVSDLPGAAAFGLVGAGIGILAAAPLWLIGGPGQEPGLAAVAAVAVVAILSGGMHLDGLADTADALLAPDAERAEAARQDPRIGPGGAVALVLVMAAQLVALGSLTLSSPPIAAAVVVAVVSVSRVVPVATGRISRGSFGEGLGTWFTTRTTSGDAIVAAGSSALVLAVLVAALWAIGSSGWPVVAAAAAASVAGLATLRVLATWRGGVDGDVLGAAVEVSVVAGLAVAAIVVA